MSLAYVVVVPKSAKVLDCARTDISSSVDAKQAAQDSYIPASQIGTLNVLVCFRCEHAALVFVIGVPCLLLAALLSCQYLKVRV